MKDSLQTIRQLFKIIFIALYDLYVIKDLETHISYYLLTSTLYSRYVTFKFAPLSCFFKFWQKAVSRHHSNVLAMAGRVGGWVGGGWGIMISLQDDYIDVVSLLT